MKKVLIVTVSLLLISTMAFAVNFSPTPMRLSAAEVISYPFDGSDVEIPLTIDGTPALIKFMVFTKDKADDIIDITNGFLGWHYMNKIDTCMYMSDGLQFGKGANLVPWDGKDSDGNIIPPGEYTYYFWGYDNQNPRTKAAPRSLGTGYAEVMIEKDEAGVPLANPMLTSLSWRWTVGSDPDDDTLTETCSITRPDGWSQSWNGKHNINPHDHSIYFNQLYNADAVIGKAFKLQWVPNDEAIFDQTFNVEVSTKNQYTTQLIDDDYMYLCELNYKETDVRTYMHLVDYQSDEGEYLGYIDHSEIFATPEDLAIGGLMNGGWGVSNIQPPYIIGGLHCGCLNVMAEPQMFFEDEEDTVRWGNGNGDYNFGDLNFETDSAHPWSCNHLGVTEHHHGLDIDSNLFTETSIIISAISFHVAGPDGTGLGKYNWMGDVDSGDRGGIVICDNGSAFDGSYTDFDTKVAEGMDGAWWVARDSIKGIIKSGGVSVDESSPAEFTVAQNSPNPFNPTTTISFSLAAAGDVTVDVFNVAGQKIDTIVDGFMDAGSHSVIWDGSEFSAGVYFYRIKAGSFNTTKRMLFIK